MAQIDDLPADQQAVLRLLLTQDRSYEEIARTLRMAPAAVRDRAHEAVGTLGPSSGAPSPSRRDEISDYLLGQQDANAAARTRSMLEDSPADRGWARVVAGELRGVAARDLPEVPDGGAASASTSALLDDDEPREASRSRRRDAGSPATSRRGGAILLGVLAFLATLAIGFFVGRATKSDDTPAATGQTAAQRAAARDVIGQANLTAAPGSGAGKALGVAQFVQRNGQNIISVLADGLPTAPKGSGYGVWMTGTGQKPVWLGYFQAVTTNGQVGAQSVLKQNPRLFQSVLITRESGRNPTSPGSTYLTGKIVFKSK